MNLRLELFVDDIRTSSDFYVGVLDFTKVKQSPDYVVVRSGNVQLGLGALANLPPGHPLRLQSPAERKGIGVEIVLETDDIFQMYKRVEKSGYPIAELLTVRPWGLTDFRLLDPDGYYLRITSTG